MKKQRSKHIRLDLIMLALTFGLHTLIEIILSVNSVLWSDTLYRDTVIPDIIASAQSILEVVVMSAGLSILTVAFFMGLRKTAYILIYICAVVYRRLLAYFVTMLINNEILALDDIFMSVSYLLLDLLILTVAVVIIHLLSKSYRRRAEMSANASALFGDSIEKPDISVLYPFKKIYGKGNPLQTCLLVLSIMLSAVKMISRTVALLVSVPDNILMMIGGYAGDLIIVVISYAVSCLLLSILYSQNEKRKAMQLLYGKD